MATIARHVIANNYSEESHEPTSSVGGVVSTSVSDDPREDSPMSSCSGQDHSEAGPGVRTGGKVGWV